MVQGKVRPTTPASARDRRPAPDSGEKGGVGEAAGVSGGAAGAEEGERNAPAFDVAAAAAAPAAFVAAAAAAVAAGDRPREPYGADAGGSASDDKLTESDSSFPSPITGEVSETHMSDCGGEASAPAL